MSTERPSFPPSLPGSKNSSLDETRIAYFRDHVLDPIMTIIELCNVMDSDRSRSPLPQAPDLARLFQVMHGSACDLYELVSNRLRSFQRASAEQPSLKDSFTDLRRKIAEKLMEIQGPAECIRDREDAAFFDQYSQELDDICAQCESCYNTLLGTEVESLPDFWPQPGLESGSLGSEQATTETREFRTGRLLIVDDSQGSRSSLASLLRRDGHEVREAATAAQATAMLTGEAFDAVIADFLLPDTPFLEWMKQVQRGSKGVYIPVIVLSGWDEKRNAADCIACGAEDFLPRPVEPILLRARVQSCLEKQRLRVKEFEQFFPADVAKIVYHEPSRLRTGRNVDVSVLFCDIRGFSAISHSNPPSVVMDWISDVMSHLTEIVIEHHGTLVRYIGDELLAMWGAPIDRTDHAQLACKAAKKMLVEVGHLSAKWRPIIGSEFGAGIGINSGSAQVGNMGSKRRFEYGPHGDAVNLASRVQTATRIMGCPLLTTGNTASHLPGDPSLRRLCDARVVNIESPVSFYEISPEDSAEWQFKRRHTDEALQYFENREFQRAIQVLAFFLEQHPLDVPAQLLLRRASNYLLDGVPDEFPVWTLPGK